MHNEREHDDLERLNAFIDGEVSPAERAEIAARLASDRGFARSHAVLVRLKAGVAEFADTLVPDEMPAAPARRHGLRRRLSFTAGIAASAAAVVLLVAGIYFGIKPPRQPDRAFDSHAIERLIVQAALPSLPAVPDLSAGGMTLSGVEVREEADRPMLVATYSGPRGCRLELRVRDRLAGETAGDGTSRHGWTVGKLHYQLVAFGMPEVRFALIAGAAERQSRINAAPGADDRLREARSAAPPCAG